MTSVRILLVFDAIVWKDASSLTRGGRMLALSTGGIVALAIVVVLLVVLFVYVFGRARR